MCLQPAGLWAHDLGAGPVAVLALGMLAVPPNPRRSFPGSGGGSNGTGGETRCGDMCSIVKFDADLHLHWLPGPEVTNYTVPTSQ